MALDDGYLGDPQLIEVYTLSGFIDICDVTHDVEPVGWNFVVQQRKPPPNGTTKRNAINYLTVYTHSNGFNAEEHYIPLRDNMMLLQPRGMQATLNHYVQGIRSPFVRWVATIRDVDIDIYGATTSTLSRLIGSFLHFNSELTKIRSCKCNGWSLSR